MNTQVNKYIARDEKMNQSKKYFLLMLGFACLMLCFISLIEVGLAEETQSAAKPNPTFTSSSGINSDIIVQTTVKNNSNWLLGNSF